ncbi:HYR domain-containing protein [Rufibacter roseolus]|uniref:HYR domain-containing protein n=1 Tax=Rufibacter roseolus TaxID=2817375 RepID=UPI001B304671|nr:HYR domain-containing protein [Rufibacter roseolus]
MRSLIIGIILVLLQFSCSLADGQSLVAHYPLNKDASDLSGNKNNGRLLGGVSPTSDRFGNPCGALAFNGVDGYIEVPSSRSLESPSTSFSAVGWFRIDNLTSTGGLKWVTLICKGDESFEHDANPQYRMQTLQSPIQSTISINTDFTEFDQGFASHPFQPGKWNFYALVYDGVSVKAYLNNDKIWEYPYNKPLTPNKAPLHIGKDIPGSLEYYHGALDDIRIYASALTDLQISQLFLDKKGVTSNDEFTLTPPANITVNADKGKCYAIVSYGPPDLQNNCGTAMLRQIAGLVSGSQFPVGSHTIAFEAVGQSGVKRTCYSKVTVKDSSPPSIHCKKDTVLWVTGEKVDGLKFSYKLPSAADNCSNVDVKLSSGLASGAKFPMGQTRLEFVATDQAGNQAKCSYLVHVKKATPALAASPTLKCPNNVNKPNDKGKCGATINLSLPNLTTLPGASMKLVSGIESGRFFPVGTTINQYSIAHADGSKQGCSIKVTIVDEERPSILLPPDTVIECAAGEDRVSFTYPTPKASDNCGVDSLVMVKGIKSGEAFPIGKTSISFRATDLKGNSVTESFTVTVNAPVIKSLPVTAPKDFVKKDYLPDAVKFLQNLSFDDCTVTMVLYDDSEQDNDTVSIYYNGKEIVKKELLKTKDKMSLVKAVILNPGEKNDFVVRAWNTGEKGPNTLRIEFYQGYYLDKTQKLKKEKPIYTKTLHSKPGYASAISLTCSSQ